MDTPVQDNMLKLIKHQLVLDMECKAPSLLAKWLPSENTSSHKTRALAARIRNYLKTCLGKSCSIKNLYIPAIEGKERRKEKPGKEGLLGVEGMTEELLSEILKNVTEVGELPERRADEIITKTTFYEDGLSGKEDSADLRKKLSKELGLPLRISANSLIEVLNTAFTIDEYRKAMDKIRKK